MNSHPPEPLGSAILRAVWRLSTTMLVCTFSIFSSTIALKQPVSAAPAHSESRQSSPIKRTKSPPVSTSKLTLENFSRLEKGADMQSVLKEFGAPARDIGSGIHIYEYELADGSKVWVGGVEKLFYVDHIQGKKHVRLVGEPVPAGGNLPAQP